MISQTWLDYIPLWLLLPATVLLVLAATEGGFWLGKRRVRSAGHKIDAPISSVIGSTLGLLAFLLAFTFGLSSSRFEKRRELLLDEVNALGTCYLRAGLTPQPQQDEVRRLLRKYVHLRAGAMLHPLELQAVLAECEALQTKLWDQAVQIGQADSESEMNALFVDSLNSVIDLHTKRIVINEYRVPDIIWLALYAVSALSMAGAGYHFGIVGGRQTTVSLLLAVSFSIVIWMIADLDRGHEGLLKVSQLPMIDLDRKLSESPR